MHPVLGIDVGTGNIVAARFSKDGKIEVESMRNMFLPISPDDLQAAELANTQLDYVELVDEFTKEVDTVAIISEDAYRFANIFGQEVRRPMKKGVISNDDIDSLDIMAAMFDKLMGGKVDKGYCVYSVPAQAVDVDIPPVLYHEKVFSKIFERLGYESKPINESMAVVYANCSDSNFSGIGISFGAGLTNFACSYKGTATLSGSVSRGGDWIDEQVAKSVGKLQTRVTRIKETKFDINNPNDGKKEERRIANSLVIYYENLIRYVLKVVVKMFKDSSEGLEIDEEVPIILSGGTSMVPGFKELFEKVFKEIEDDFPYDISEIRSAKEPLMGVAIGSLIYATWEQKRKDTSNEQRSTKGQSRARKSGEAESGEAGEEG